MPDGLSFYCLTCNRRRAKTHYRKRRAAVGAEVREPDLSPPGFKRCATCATTKATTEFHKHPTQSDGLNSSCKPCRKERQRRDHLKSTYGLTEDDLIAMIEAQGGLCAICKRRPAVHVDHDHVFEIVRGVLCFPCNVALGQMQDDIENLKNAIDYLERTTWQRTLVSPGVYQLTSPRPAAAASPTSSELQRLISSQRG